MSTLLIAPQLGVPSETFIARHAELLREKNHLAIQIVPGVVLDHKWNGVPVLGLGNKRLRPVYARLWRSALRRIGLNLSSWYSFDFALDQLLKDYPIPFDRILIEYADTAYNMIEHGLRWLREGKHVVVHFHGYDAVEASFPSDYVMVLRQLAEFGAIFVANSQFTVESIAGWQFPEDRLVVKHYGVEIPQTRREHHTKHAINILHLGRLVDFKAPHLTIQAFEIACERGLDGNLIIAGDGDLRERCEGLRVRSRWRDRISILGAVDWQRAETLRLSADVFTLHSVVGETSQRIENLGVAVLEAMANGLPVVTCAMGGIKETMIDRETGLFFPTGDVEAQADAFLILARNPEFRKRLGLQGRERIIQHFSIDRERRELLKLLGYPHD